MLTRVRPSIINVIMDPSLPRYAPEVGGTSQWLGERLDDFNPKIFEVHAHAGERLPRAIRELRSSGPVGIIAGGGGSMVTDELPWVNQTGKDLLTALERYPELAICLSAQLMAKTLGGAVDYNVKGPEKGTQPIHVVTTDPFFRGVSSVFDAQETHFQHVTRLPKAATWLAGNAMSPVQAWRLERLWATQYHPEMPATAARSYVRTANLDNEVRETPAGPRQIQNWMELNGLHGLD